jgi:hypothetical protein
MEPEELEAGHTAVSYADLFAEKAVAKLDALFGPGYAKANPALMGAYIAACATNLNSFMIAASQVPADDIDSAEAIAALQAAFAEPRNTSKGKRSR